MELSVSSETTFFNMKLQLEICPQLRTGSSAEDRGRIDTRGHNPNIEAAGNYIEYSQNYSSEVCISKRSLVRYTPTHMLE